jgi:hypothetical protein
MKSDKIGSSQSVPILAASSPVRAPETTVSPAPTAASRPVVAPETPPSRPLVLPSAVELSQDLGAVFNHVNAVFVAGMEVLERLSSLQEAVPQFATEGGQSIAAEAPPNSIAHRFYDPTQKLSVKINADERLDLSTPETRLAFANTYTQLNGAHRPATEFGCGPSCVALGSLITGGQDGILALCDTIEKHGNHSFTFKMRTFFFNDPKWDKIPGYDKLDEIKTRAKNNTLTRGDIATLQEIVYHQLRHLENNQRNGGDGTSAIQRDVLQTYLKSSPALAKLFADKMDIHHIDTDNSPTSGEHFVLSFQAGNPPSLRVFDPWPRKDGQQVVDQKHGMGAYLAASLHQGDGKRTYTK